MGERVSWVMTWARSPVRCFIDDIYRWYAGAQGALHYGGAHGDAVRYRHPATMTLRSTRRPAQKTLRRADTFPQRKGNGPAWAVRMTLVHIASPG